MIQVLLKKYPGPKRSVPKCVFFDVEEMLMGNIQFLRQRSGKQVLINSISMGEVE